MVIMRQATGEIFVDTTGPGMIEITGAALSIPVMRGIPALGTWQSVFLIEHRREGSRRHIAVHLMGE